MFARIVFSGLLTSFQGRLPIGVPDTVVIDLPVLARLRICHTRWVMVTYPFALVCALLLAALVPAVDSHTGGYLADLTYRHKENNLFSKKTRLTGCSSG